MKNKVIKSCLLLIPLTILSGCGKNDNKLVCSMETGQGAVKSSYTINYDSDWEEIDSILIEEVVDFSKVEDLSVLGCGNNLEECMNNAKSDYEMCKNNDAFSNCKITEETKNSLKITSEVNKEELKKDNNIFYVTTKTSKEKAKEILKEKGFKCE